MGEHDEAIDPAAVIERMRVDEDVPAEVLSQIERQFEIFRHHLSEAQDREALEQAFGFGLIVGSYETAPEAKKYAEKQRQSQAGKASGEARKDRPWHEHAKELAKAIRAEDPKLSQDDVAAEIEERWKLIGKPPKFSTLKTFVATLEARGELQRRVR